MMTPDLGAWLAQAAARLGGLTDTPALEARLLAAQVMRKESAWLLAHPEAVLSVDQVQHLDDLLTRRAAGEPLPYLLGEWQFFGLPFFISPVVLIPRPETELLVETALTWLQQHPERRTAADVGTGSGCIAVTLAQHVKDLQVWAVDLSAGALDVARRNAIRHGVADRIQFLPGDLLAGVPGQVDLVCANLPYIPTETLRRLPVSQFEPGLALDGGWDGLSIIRRLLAELPGKLLPGGLALLEIEARQGAASLAAAAQALPAARAAIRKDLSGHDRLLVIEMDEES